MSEDYRENRVLPVLLGVTELMVAVVLLAWAAFLVLLALLVSAVTLGHRASPDRRVPLVRRAPPGYQAQRGSRAHRVRSEPWVHPGWRDFPEWKEPRDPPAGRGTTST